MQRFPFSTEARRCVASPTIGGMDIPIQTLDTKALAPILGISLSTLRKIVCDPRRLGIECPMPLDIPRRKAHLWLLEDVRGWLEARRVPLPAPPEPAPAPAESRRRGRPTKAEQIERARAQARGGI